MDKDTTREMAKKLRSLLTHEKLEDLLLAPFFQHIKEKWHLLDDKEGKIEYELNRLRQGYIRGEKIRTVLKGLRKLINIIYNDVNNSLIKNNISAIVYLFLTLITLLTIFLAFYINYQVKEKEVESKQNAIEALQDENETGRLLLHKLSMQMDSIIQETHNKELEKALFYLKKEIDKYKQENP